jgi:hypothetical protein
MYRLGYEGAPPPPWLQERFDAGHMHEPLIMERLAMLDYKISNEQATVEIPCGPGALIRGHIDGLNTSDRFRISSFNDKSEPQGSSWFMPGIEGFACVVDAKALSQSSFEKWIKGGFKNFPYYLWQQAIYIYALEADGVLMAVKNKNTDKILCDYYTRDWIEERLPLGTIIARVLEVEKIAREEGETGCFERPCDGNQFPCPFYSFKPQKDIPVAEGYDENELRALIVEYNQKKELAKNADADRKKIGNKIAELLGNIEATARVDNFQTKVYYGSTKSAPDWLKLAERLGEDVEFVQKEYTIPPQKNNNLITEVRKVKGTNGTEV